MNTEKSMGGKNWNVFLYTLFLLPDFSGKLLLGEYAYQGDKMKVINTDNEIECLTDKYVVSNNGILTDYTIQQNEGSTNCTLVDKVAALNSTNPTILKAINTAYGQKYTAVLTMLNTIQQSPAMKSDSNFAMIVNTQLSNPSINGPNSSYNAVDQFLKTAAS